MASFKRARSPAVHQFSPPSSTSSSPTLKAARTSATPPPQPSTSTAAASHILCTLPPTCNHRPTSVAVHELQAHYARHHAHVCELGGCGCVFPDARFLELHQTECHDPIAAVRKDRGERIFACFVETCSRHFAAPKARRLHLIQVHGYPKEYFFAVTNKGVGGLLKKWGEGASLLRKPWKPRENAAQDGAEGAEDESTDDATSTDAQTDQQYADAPDEDDDEEDQVLLGKIQIDRTSTQAPAPPTEGSTTPAAPSIAPESDRNGKGKMRRSKRNPRATKDVDHLAEELDSLSLVPPSIQFGRGAKRGARGHARAPRGSAGRGERAGDSESMDVDHGRGGPPLPPRGGALRGVMRGRGRGPRGSLGALGAGIGRGHGSWARSQQGELQTSITCIDDL